MGYTHYFNFKEDIKSFSEEVLTDIKTVLAKYEDILEVESITDDKIFFNGLGYGAYEDFALRSDTTDFNFCKTARRPYDLPVCEVLLVLKHHYKDNFELGSDGFSVSKENFIKKNLDGTWNEAIKNVKDQFGYEFDFMGMITGDGVYKYYSFNITSV